MTRQQAGQALTNGVFNTLTDARSLWRQMKNSSTIGNLIEQARDEVGANYTNAGFQTALKQVFKNFKGQTAEGC
jgi:hypothetical protein